MQSDRYLPEDGSLTSCSWCGEQLGLSPLPPNIATVFCSRRCEIEANFWFYTELCAIEIMRSPDPDEGFYYYERP